MAKTEFGKQWHQMQLGNVDHEIARMAAICDIRILDPGVIERVIANDSSVCGRRSEQAFRKLKKLIGMHYALANDSVASIGIEESGKILDEIRTRLRRQFDIGGEH